MSASVFSQRVANFLVAYLVPQQVHLTSVPGTFAFYAVCCARRFRVGLCFRPGNEGFALGGDWQVVRRTSGGPRRVCSSNMLGFLCQCVAGVWLGVSCTSGHVVVSLFVCVSIRVCLSLSLSVRLVRKRREQDQAYFEREPTSREELKKRTPSYHPLGKPCCFSIVGSVCLLSLEKEEASDSHMGVEGAWWCVYVCVCACVCTCLCTCTSVPICVSPPPSLFLLECTWT